MNKSSLLKFATLCAASMIFLMARHSAAQQPVSAAIAPTAPTPATPPTMPADQAAFLAAHKALALQALFGNDPAAISRQWNSRAKEFIGVGKPVTNWIGTIREVFRNPDGYRLVVAMNADGKNSVFFATDLLTNPVERNLIPASGDNFSFLKKAKADDRIGFSGSVVSKQDGTLVLLASGGNTTDEPVYAFKFTHVRSAEETLKEMAAAQREAAEKVAQDKALREEASKAPPIDRDKLVANSYYRIGGVTPLRAAPPATSADATPLPPPIQIPPDTMIFVHAVQQIDGTPWYNVTVDMQLDPLRRKGWINSKELTEKEVFAFDRVVVPTPSLTIRTETAYNNAAGTDARKPKPGDIRQVYIVGNAKDELYHAPGCQRLRGQVTKLHVFEATKQGYKPCPVCFDTTRSR